MPTQFSNDFYQTVSLWGGWNIGKKWQVLGFIPFNINRQSSDDGEVKSSGLGDISFLVNYSLLNKQSTNGVSQQLWLGAGLKIPTGKFSPDPADIIPQANNQAGTGSVDYLLNSMYALQIKNWGINSSLGYKINSKADNYQFGDRLDASTFVFRSFSKGTTVISPNLGLLYENLQANKLDGVKVADSGGNALMGAAGVETGFKKLSIGLNWQFPVGQNYSSGQTTIKARGMAHVTFVF